MGSISTMQSVNGAQYLNITFLLLLLAAAIAPAVFRKDIIPLTSICCYNQVNLTFALKF